MIGASRVLLSASVVVSVVLACGCSGATEPTSSVVTLSNRGGDSVAVRLMELETSKRADPVVGPVPLSVFGQGVVPPNGEIPRDLASVSGYTTGRDLQVWVYRVKAGAVTLANSWVVTDQAMKAARFRIEVALPAN